MNNLEYAINKTMDRMAQSAAYHMCVKAAVQGNTVQTGYYYVGGPTCVAVYDANGKHVDATKQDDLVGWHSDLKDRKVYSYNDPRTFTSKGV